ncbi:MAG TPA: hypothetical protein VGQ88_11320, partial [Burkholderiales bacterium]|nr:hypothetical protein [Burkholderiales bacterium]
MIAAVEESLRRLGETSFAAHREVLDTLPALQHHGDETIVRWLAAARRLIDHDRDAGKAFIRGSREAEKVS